MTVRRVALFQFKLVTVILKLKPSDLSVTLLGLFLDLRLSLWWVGSDKEPGKSDWPDDPQAQGTHAICPSVIIVPAVVAIIDKVGSHKGEGTPCRWDDRYCGGYQQPKPKHFLPATSVAVTRIGSRIVATFMCEDYVGPSIASATGKGNEMISRRLFQDNPLPTPVADAVVTEHELSQGNRLR
jgi:hypothetical protein